MFQLLFYYSFIIRYRLEFFLGGGTMTFMQDSFISHGLTETEKVAGDFVKGLMPRTESATIVCLSGDLGSGKTTFTKAAAAALGISETVTSPTFVIEKIYELTGQVFSFLIHIDAYRLERGEELVQLGWGKIIADQKNLIFIEWPERVPGIIPKDAIKISFTGIDENSREIAFENHAR